MTTYDHAGAPGAYRGAGVAVVVALAVDVGVVVALPGVTVPGVEAPLRSGAACV